MSEASEENPQCLWRDTTYFVSWHPNTDIENRSEMPISPKYL